ncbi:MAG TPA: hypothetical protein VNN07_10200 [Candidatus Tectomicrobia bacterium]|nr:hypothetical protein [Candidatus Tectomicrobia bacterium]
MLLLLLLAADAAFVAVHLVHTYTPALPGAYNSLAQDRGHAEHFQYVKLYWLVILFAVLAVRERALPHAGWGALFAALLLDDALMVHERLGAAMADALALPSAGGLRPGDLGQAIVYFAAVALLVTLLLPASRRAAGSPAAALSGALLPMLGAFVAFGVLVDLAGTALRGSALEGPLVMLEDGGEMVAVSLILGVVFRAAQPSWRAARAADAVARRDGAAARALESPAAARSP